MQNKNSMRTLGIEFPEKETDPKFKEPETCN